MKPFGSGHTDVVDLGQASAHLRANYTTSRLQQREALYHALGRPLGENKPWSFGLWLVFGTFTTTN